MVTQRIVVDPGTRVMVMTGAGVSAESGIPTFRDVNRLWETHRVESVASPEGFATDPGLVWRFYSQRRAAAAICTPNAGHNALVALEECLGDGFLLATQNVDGLHRVAGTSRLVEMHGNLFTSRCSVCDLPPFADREVYATGTMPTCTGCAKAGVRSYVRPHIVWFGEGLDARELARIEDFMTSASQGRWIFVAVGTSGTVYPAAGLVSAARRRGADTWLVNLQPSDNTGLFDHFVQGASGEVLPGLFEVRAS